MKRNEKIYDVAVVGAGASGMMAALTAAEAGASAVMIDGNDRAGKKLYATGNGRCNFTNLHAEGGEETVVFFRRIGLLSRTGDEGRCYPYSGQAASLVGALGRALLRAGAEFRPGDRAVGIEERGSGFAVECGSGADVRARTVIIATGGRAGLQYGSTGDGYGFAKSFGHTLVPPRPALVAVESDDQCMSALKGVRAKAGVTLELEGNVIASESGEVQFTGSGISGICVFDLTRYMDAPRPQRKKRSGGEARRNYVIAADLAPDFSCKELAEFLHGELREALEGVVNTKLAGVIADMAAIPDNSRKTALRAVHLLKRFKVNVLCTKGWKDAQVTAGGVRLDEIDAETMESKLKRGLYFCGEVLDYDGRCGGYNLQWAWSSGRAAGRAAAERCNDIPC